MAPPESPRSEMSAWEFLVKVTKEHGGKEFNVGHRTSTSIASSTAYALFLITLAADPNANRCHPGCRSQHRQHPLVQGDAAPATGPPETPSKPAKNRKADDSVIAGDASVKKQPKKAANGTTKKPANPTAKKSKAKVIKEEDEDPDAPNNDDDKTHVNPDSSGSVVPSSPITPAQNGAQENLVRVAEIGSSALKEMEHDADAEA